jgi:hypothetical protein
MRMAQLAVHRLRSAVLVLALAGLGGLAGAATALASTPVPVLTAISATHHPGYDRLVFRFAGVLPAHRRARYVTVTDSALPVNVVGGARLLVSFSRATGLDSQGLSAYGPASRSYALPGVIQVVTAHDRGAVVSFGVGVVRREPFRVYTLAHPSRVVIDVQTPYRTARVRDYFVNSSGMPRPAARPVIRSDTAYAALRGLYAGPTQAELARGLRFVASGTTGFSYVTIAGGIARVQLTGGCSSSGSTVTVANEIVPTLRQFHSVRWVKIYDPSGHTEHPANFSNSLPACLTVSAAARLKGPVIIALAIVTGLGVLLGLALTVLSVLAGLAVRPSLITPSAWRAERVAAKPVQTGQFAPDAGWPFYPFRQARADLARIEAERRARYRRVWNWPLKPFVWILLLPVSAAAVIGLLVAGLTTVVLFGLLALVTWTSAAVCALTFSAGVALLRGVEKSWHTVMGTEASCPRCYHVTIRPAYRCSGCQALHRDIRPGRLGLVFRRCECGAHLPTMVLRAAWHLEAVCQRCEKPLRFGSGALRDVRVPIFGDTSAGKTRFLYAALDSLIATTSRAGIALGFPDEDSENEATLALDLIRSGQDTMKTTFILPTALTCRVGTGARSTLVHLFDAAGEYYRGAEMHDSLGFLDRGHGLVYVLDPFSVGSVRDRMTGHSDAGIRLAHAAAGDPETAYGEVVTRLRDSGVEAQSQRLAVVVSKADLLSDGGLELPDGSDAIADWLTEAGVHNLVLSARREFAEVRYFAVASQAAGQTGPSRDAGAPLRWLLASRGLRLPVGPAAGDAPRTPRSRLPGSDNRASGQQVGAAQGETAEAKP